MSQSNCPGRLGTRCYNNVVIDMFSLSCNVKDHSFGFCAGKILPPYHTLSASVHLFCLLLYVFKCWGVVHIMNVPILPTFYNQFFFSQWSVWLVDLTPCIPLTRLIPFVKSTLNCLNKSLSFFNINGFIFYLFYMLSPVNISNLNSKCYFVHGGWQIHLLLFLCFVLFI